MLVVTIYSEAHPSLHGNVLFVSISAPYMVQLPFKYITGQLLNMATIVDNNVDLYTMRATKYIMQLCHSVSARQWYIFNPGPVSKIKRVH